MPGPALFGLLAALLLPGALFPAAAAEPRTLTYSWPSNVGPLNPHLYAPNQMFAQAMVYEPLVRYGPGGRIVPWLAETWEVSGDGRAYTFRLRHGVRFSDGTPFDADAVKRNIEAVLAAPERHGWLELVAQIEGADALDPLTLRLRLKQPYQPALQELALVRPLRFLSPAAMPEDGNTARGIKAPVGTGPWVLAETRRGEYDLFVRNDHYWGERPRFDRVLVKVIPDPNSRLLAFEAGELDLIYGSGDSQIGPDSFRRFAESGRWRTALSEPLATRTLTLNGSDGPTAELDVRRAIQRAVNRPLLLRAVLEGMEHPAEALFAPNLPYADLGLTAPPHDPAAAMALLEGSGWAATPGRPYREKDGRELAVELCFIGNDPQQKAVAEVVQSDLKRVGIRALLVGEEANAIAERMRTGRFGMVFADSWGAPYDPHSFLGSMRVPSHADYQAQRALPMKAEIDAGIGRALVSSDEAERKSLYRKVLTTLHEQAIYLPLSHMAGSFVHGANVTGVRFGWTMYEIPFEAMDKVEGKAPGDGTP
ncbi:nickel ABC transporter substrate-binding protein [Azospirillum sp. SYSU D00513]|uniref:nickel ABC transporter substrate-binding protein n=1 Tax=Azospirillum sp. SYSU D00513 TaxID=2812561 RepID=UPI001A978F42|nr:nickel ABC transporter substrate-binding protein [Azospirillum sp. SYSU D00513]